MLPTEYSKSVSLNDALRTGNLTPVISLVLIPDGMNGQFEDAGVVDLYTDIGDRGWNVHHPIER